MSERNAVSRVTVLTISCRSGGSFSARRPEPVRGGRSRDRRDVDRFGEAEALFRRPLSNRGEAPDVRRPAASGAVKLLKRGYRSAGLVNELLQAAQDPDATVARSSFVGLTQLPPEEIVEDMLLLLRSLGPRQRQLLCVAVRSQPTVTGFLMVRWLLDEDPDPAVLASALDAVGETYTKAREERDAELIETLWKSAVLSHLAERTLALSFHQEPNVIAGSLKIFQELLIINRV
jgi:hypothetical protein